MTETSKTQTRKSRQRVRFEIADRGAESSGYRWQILDRQTNLYVDEASSTYEARQALRAWNGGEHDDLVTPEVKSQQCPRTSLHHSHAWVWVVKTPVFGEVRTDRRCPGV